MALMEPVPYIIIAIIVYGVWNWSKKPNRRVSFLGRGVFLVGCVILMTHYTIPLALDAITFNLFMDPLLPIGEAIKINHLAQIMEDKRHMDYYFANIIPLFSGAAMLGFSMDLAFDLPLPRKKHLLYSILIPAGFFVFHAAFRLITGYKWKIADSGQIIWFVLFYFVGYGVCLLSEKVRKRISTDGNSLEK